MRRPAACAILGRRALTLVELLTAMAIVILLAAITVPTVATLLRGDRLRGASASVQAAITSARERAVIDGAPRGIRLIPDADNPELCRQIIFIRESAATFAGGSMSGGAIISDYLAPRLFYDVLEVEYDPRFVQDFIKYGNRENVKIVRHGIGSTDPNDPGIAVYRGAVRLGASGPFRPFSFLYPESNPEQNDAKWRRKDTSPWRMLFVLDEPLLGAIPADVSLGTGSLQFSGLFVQLLRPPVALEGADPLVLPTGIVIDLGSLPKSPDSVNPPTTPIPAANLRLTRLTPRLSLGVPLDPANPSVVDYGFEVMFSPERDVIGPASVDERIILWLRDESAVLAEPNPQSEIQTNLFRKEIRASSTASNSLVVLNTRTGEIGAFRPVLVDQDTEKRLPDGTTTITPGADDWFDWSRYYENVVNGVGVND